MSAEPAEKHPKVCTICGEPVLARGLCNRHYKRLRKKGDANAPVRDVNVGHTCKVPGCLRPAVIHGMCKMHDKRVRKSGVPGPASRLRYQTKDSCFCGLPALPGSIYCRAHHPEDADAERI